MHAPSIDFVFLGHKLPSYVVPSLRLFRRYNTLPINLLANAECDRQIPSGLVNFVAIEDFYKKQNFHTASTNLSVPSGFRGGFWFKALERFFVLEQYLKCISRDHSLHAELDQVFFSAQDLFDCLAKQEKKGLFFPLHHRDTGLASVLYINDVSAITSLIARASSGPNFPNEMRLLADWALENPGRFHRLPTLADVHKDLLPAPVDLILEEPEKISSVVDAAQLGQWIAGIDVRNLQVGEKSLTKFVDPPNEMLLRHSELSEYSFWLEDSGKLVAVNNLTQNRVVVFNLHVHSKIHRYLSASHRQLTHILKLANRPERFLVPGAQFSAGYWKVRHRVDSLLRRLSKKVKRLRSVLLHWRIRVIRSVGWRPTSRPYLSGDSFRAIADIVWEGHKRPSLDKAPKGTIVFCEGHLLSELSDVAKATPALGLVLVAGNSDANHYGLAPEITESGTFSAVFAQNLLAKHPLAAPIPIGLENRFRQHHGLPRKFSRCRKEASDRKPRIMWSFDVNTNPRARGEARSALERTSVADEIGWLSPAEHRRALMDYSFAACPQGNGVDTHRVWEALYLRCVPIVTRAYPFEYFESLGIPIWIVESFEDLADLAEDDLAHLYEAYSQRFEAPALWFPFWESATNQRKLS